MHEVRRCTHLRYSVWSSAWIQRNAALYNLVSCGVQYYPIESGLVRPLQCSTVTNIEQSTSTTYRALLMLVQCNDTYKSKQNSSSSLLLPGRLSVKSLILSVHIALTSICICILKIRRLSLECTAMHSMMLASFLWRIKIL